MIIYSSKKVQEEINSLRRDIVDLVSIINRDPKDYPALLNHIKTKNNLDLGREPLAWACSKTEKEGNDA